MDRITALKHQATLLHAHVQTTINTGPLVLRVTHNLCEHDRERHALLGPIRPASSLFAAHLTFDQHTVGDNVVRLPSELLYLTEGDIVRIDPRSSRIQVLYRVSSPNNAIFVTEQCNSYV